MKKGKEKPWNKAWWLLAIFFGLIGGIIAFFVVRKLYRVNAHYLIWGGLLINIGLWWLWSSWSPILLNLETETTFDEGEWVKEMLEDQGYEVIWCGLLDLTNTGYVEMKALGNRNNQVREGLIVLGIAYKNVSIYTIRILEERQECWYNIDGDIYRLYKELSRSDETIIINGTEFTAYDLYIYIDDQIEQASERCF